MSTGNVMAAKISEEKAKGCALDLKTKAAVLKTHVEYTTRRELVTLTAGIRVLDTLGELAKYAAEKPSK